MKRGWIWAWLIQIAVMLAVGALTALAGGAGAAVSAAMQWGFAPAAGLFTAYFAVRHGLNNYLAWIAPAPCLLASSLLIWGYSPPAGPALLTAFTSLVGAATGVVALQQGGNKRRNPHRRR